MSHIRSIKLPQTTDNKLLCSHRVTTGDYFVESAAAMLYDAYAQTFSKVTDEAVLTDNLVVATKVSSLTNGLLNVVSLSRYVFAAL